MRNLVISLVTVVVLATISLGWLFDKIYQQYSTNEVRPTAVEIFETLGLDFAKALDDAPNSEIMLSYWPQSSLYSITLNSFVDSALPDEMLQTLKQNEVVVLETKNSILFHYLLKNKNQILVLESPHSSDADDFSSEQYVLTLSFYVFLILLFLIWAYPLMKQLSSLRKAAKNFGSGKLDQRITPNSISYIRDIEIEFNNMATRIKNLVGDVQLLSTAVSHDLRTPLARIRFGLDTLEEVYDDTLRIKLQIKLSEDVDEMTSLVESLLNYARLDQHTLILNRQPIELLLLVEQCIKKKQSDKVKISFKCTAQYAVTVADRSYLKMALNNILQNAINYGEGIVNVTLDEDHNLVIIRVSDNGKGVPENLRDQIVKPFIRGTKLENQNKGHGMGLAIVNRVIEWHNGHLDISDSTELSGATFTMSLPKNKQ